MRSGEALGRIGQPGKLAELTGKTLPGETIHGGSPSFSWGAFPRASCRHFFRLHKSRFPWHILLLIAAAALHPFAKAERKWLPADSAAVRYVSHDPAEPQSWLTYEPDPHAWAQSAGRAGQGILYSPDGQYFFVQTSAGDLISDRIISTLRVFSVKGALGRRSQARAVQVAGAVFPSSPRGGSGILDARWEADGRGVLFRGVADSGLYEGYRLDLAGGTVARLTRTPAVPSELISTGVSQFWSRGGRHVFMLSGVMRGPLTSRYPMEAFAQTSFEGVRTPLLRSLSVWFKYYTSNDVDGRCDELDPFYTAAISPDGRYAAIYQPTLHRFVVLKFELGAPPRQVVSVAADASAGSTEVFWSADSRVVLFMGVTGRINFAESVPLAEGGERYIAAFEPESGSWHRVERLTDGEKLESIRWSEERGELMFNRTRGKEPGKSFVYQLRGGKWKPRAGDDVVLADAKRLSDNQSIVIRQSENEPPMVAVVMKGRQTNLLPPDPALKGVRLTPVTHFQWRGVDGKARTGGLLLPASYRPGRPVPIVIQPYYYIREIFLPDGQSRTADAAQALAARGIAVLMVDGTETPAEADRRDPEGPEVIREQDVLIDALVAQGITTATQVGVTGFSRGGYQAYYAITHPTRVALAAAVVSDAFTGSFPQRLQEYTTAGYGSFLADRVFWSDRLYWLENDVTFNVDRVVTPTLFSENTAAGNLLGDATVLSLQTIGAFQLNHKPLEYLSFSKGVHQLARPLERVAMMSSVVDWMAFWLKGEEDPAPSKAVQYQRWRKLRQEWSQERAKEPSGGEGGFITSRSGLRYAIRTRRIGKSAAVGDEITLNYIALKPNGREFANTYRSGRERTVRLGEPILPGLSLSSLPASVVPDRPQRAWQEVLGVLHEGEKVTVFVPAELAGEDAQQEVAGSFLRYEVEVTRIIRTSGSGAATAASLN